MARRATFIDSVRALNSNTLVVEAGDFSDVNETWGQLKNDFLVRMMTRLGYDAMSLGERDLRWSALHTQEVAGERPALLMNNVSVEKNGEFEPLGVPPLVRDMDGVRVGTFGLVHDNILSKAGSTGDQLKADDVFESADRIVADLTNQGCEIIVFVAQMELAFADSVIRRLPEIDVAVLGHRGGLRPTHSTIGNTIVIRPGRRGQYIGALDLVVNPAGEIAEFGGQTVALDAKVEKDPTVLALANDMEAEINRLKKEQQTVTQTEYQNQQEVDRFLGANACARCHATEFEKWQGGPHAHAWQTLVDLGMDSSDECVACHVTGHGDRTGFQSARMKPDLTSVQCEACHQMGTLHELDAPQVHTAASTCTSCHDQTNSPDFELDSYLEAIRHW